MPQVKFAQTVRFEQGDDRMTLVCGFRSGLFQLATLMRIAAFMTLTVTRHSVSQVRLYQYELRRSVLTGAISLNDLTGTISMPAT